MPSPLNNPSAQPIYYTHAELEACRSTLTNIGETLVDVATILPAESMRSSAELALRQFQEFTPEQLAICMTAIDQINELSAALTELRSQVPFKPSGTAKGTDTCPDPAVLPTNHCGELPAAPYWVPDGGDDGWDSIQELYGAQEGEALSEKIPPAVTFIADIAVSLAESAYAAIEPASKQTAAGFNAAITSMPFKIAVAIVKAAFGFLKDIGDEIDSVENEGAFLRLGHLHTDVGQMAADVESLKAAAQGQAEEIAQLRTEVEALRIANCEIIRLLHTPEKKRASVCPTCEDQPGFPYEWAQKGN